MPHRHFGVGGAADGWEREEAKPSMDDEQGGKSGSVYISSAEDLGREEASWSGGSWGVVVDFEGDWGTLC